MTEDIREYVSRKRQARVHGDHVDLQALAEVYARTIHVYEYSAGEELITNSPWG
jgi:OTU domain-containing protein 5